MLTEPSPSSHDFAESSFVNIEAWTEETLQSIRKLRVTSSPEAVRQAVSLSIPLDSPDTPLSADKLDGGRVDRPSRHDTEVDAHPSEPRRRDSLKRREALLKGKEGSRRRQKWENGNSQTFGTDRHHVVLTCDIRN
jgi:hypothetical protein